MTNFKFSIITVVKNDENNIAKTINSVLDQRQFVKLEYILIDGNSSDKTLDIIKSYSTQIDRVVSENDLGIYHAMNKAISLSTGDIIGICNSGDIIFPKGLFYVNKKFGKNYDFVFGTVIRKYLGENILKYGFNKKRIFYNFDFATAHSTGFYVKNTVMKLIGNYNTKFKCSSDYDYYFRLIDSNNFIGSSTGKDEIVGEVASGGYSSKLSFYQHLMEETKIRLHNKQNVLIVILIFTNAIFKNFLKKFK